MLREGETAGTVQRFTQAVRDVHRLGLVSFQEAAFQDPARQRSRALRPLGRSDLDRHQVDARMNVSRQPFRGLAAKPYS